MITSKCRIKFASQHDSGSSASNGVEVQVLSFARKNGPGVTLVGASGRQRAPHRGAKSVHRGSLGILLLALALVACGGTVEGSELAELEEGAAGAAGAGGEAGEPAMAEIRYAPGVAAGDAPISEP